jgi:hypothetical protein
MITGMFTACQLFDSGREDEANALMRSVPLFQLEAYWEEVQRMCDQRRESKVAPRPVNGFNVETSKAADRCLSQSPDGRGLIYLQSGGSLLAYGVCCSSKCPILKNARG